MSGHYGPSLIEYLLRGTFAALNRRGSRIRPLVSSLLFMVTCVKLAPLGLSGRSEVVAKDRFQLLTHAVSAARLEGLWLEFGVSAGESVNHIAREIRPRVIHGFDSFWGLPTDWNRLFPRGSFSLGGRLPQVEQNVRLHKGLFEQTLPGFLDENPGPVAFAHVDCDLYSSTRVVLESLWKRIVPGTVIVFDEFATPSPVKNEAHAFQEFLRRSRNTFEILGLCEPGWLGEVRVSVRVL